MRARNRALDELPSDRGGLRAVSELAAGNADSNERRNRGKVPDRDSGIFRVPQTETLNLAALTRRIASNPAGGPSLHVDI